MSWRISVPSWSTKDYGKDIVVSDAVNPPQLTEFEDEIILRAKQAVNQELLTHASSALLLSHTKQRNIQSEITAPPIKKWKKIDVPTESSNSAADLSAVDVALAKQLHKRARQREKRFRKRLVGDVSVASVLPFEQPKDQPAEGNQKKQKKEVKAKERTQQRADHKVTDKPPSPLVKERSSSNPLPAVSKLQTQQEKQLKGARFRWLNERLYTIRGEEALAMIKDSPDLFDAYHEGFASQVRNWPINPVDLIIKELKTLPKTAVIADFGCGDAKISASVPQRVHSFDLHAVNDRVIACDIAHVPLKDSSIDVAVFSLALMGTNLDDFIAEAYRVLKPAGLLKIAEVRSRFDEEHGGLEKFEKALHTAGFDVKKRDVASLMFVKFDFAKSGTRTPQRPGLTLKPCIYKRR